MANRDNISDELLAAFLEGNVDNEEMARVLKAVGRDEDLQETLDIALQVEEAEELPMLQMAAEGGRNLCDVQCEAYVLKRFGIDCSVDELLEVAKKNHWIQWEGTPLRYIGNLLKDKGLLVTRSYKAAVEDIDRALKDGNGVIVAVDSDKLYPERPDEEDATNHAIVVTSLDAENVTIFDPGNTDEVDIPLPLFMAAWRESMCYLVKATDKN